MSSSGAAQSKARCVVCHASYARGERFCPLDGGAIVDEQASNDPLIGRTIDDRYLVRRFIGKGGMGAVYEAEHIGLDRQVAIKFMSDGEADRDLRARFRQEARAASRIVDEHVVQIFDVGVAEDGRDYIVMELVEGKNLHETLAAGMFEPVRAAGIARQILLGLDAIHAAGIVHRDIKPPNVLLLDRDGDFVKLMDFGIAKSMGNELAQTNTGTGRVVGTVHYMAPEQLGGEDVDPRADLYAVGVTLFVMLAGELPFTGSSGTYATATLSQPAPSLATLRPDVPAELVAAVARALEKAPADRFATALEFAAALGGVAGPMSRPSRPAADRAPATTPNRSRDAAPATTPLRSRSAERGDAAPAPTERDRSTPDAVATAVDRISAPPSGVAGPRPARRIPWMHICVCVAAVALVVLVVMKIREDKPAQRPAPAQPVAPAVAAPVADRAALARAAEDRRDLPLAIALYEEELAAHPQPTLLYRIGDLYERLGDRAKAASYLARYVDASPDAVDHDAVRARIARLADVADAGVVTIEAPKPIAGKAASKPAVADVPAQPQTGPRCGECKATDASGYTHPLCVKKMKAPWCTCLNGEASELCPNPWTKVDSNDMPAADGGYSICVESTKPGCSQAPFAKDCYHHFNKPAPAGGACKGYSQKATDEQSGTWSCNWCDDGDFHGHTGDPCAGFDASGAANTGVLSGCH